MDHPPQAYSDIINKKEGYNMSDFKNMTLVQLKAYAQENGIDLKGAKTKTSVISTLTNISSSISVASDPVDVIGSTTIVKEKRIPESATKTNEDGILTTKTADNFKDKVFKKEAHVNDLKIAIHSDKNMSWVPVGKINRGYNIVTKEESEKWLSRKGVREATPQEIATHYGI